MSWEQLAYSSSENKNNKRLLGLLAKIKWWLRWKASVYNVGDLGSIPGSGISLEKETATHSSTLAWKIPWTEEPGVHGVAKSQTRLSNFTFFVFFHSHM